MEAQIFEIDSRWKPCDLEKTATLDSKEAKPITFVSDLSANEKINKHKELGRNKI